MADYAGDSLNGVEKSPSLLSPDESHGLFFQKDGSFRLVKGPMGATTSQKEVLASGNAGNPTLHGQPAAIVQRFRFTVAQVNAGATVLAAIPGLKYRVTNCAMIAAGGAVGAVTSIDVKGTRSGAVTLFSYAQASLTQSTYLAPGVSGCTILADGASFTQLDANSAITVIKNDSDITGATNIDVILTYSVEA